MYNEGHINSLKAVAQSEWLDNVPLVKWGCEMDDDRRFT